MVPGIGEVCKCGSDGFVGPIAMRKLIAFKQLVHLAVRLRDYLAGDCPICGEMWCEKDCPNGDIREFLHVVGLPIKEGGYADEEVAEYLQSGEFNMALLRR